MKVVGSLRKSWILVVEARSPANHSCWSSPDLGLRTRTWDPCVYMVGLGSYLSPADEGAETNVWRAACSWECRCLQEKKALSMS